MALPGAAASTQFSGERFGRRRLRALLAETRPVSTNPQSINTLASEAEHVQALDRIRRAAMLAQDIAPKNPPILQTVLDGAGREWDQAKQQMDMRLADWARVAEDNRLKLAVKSHFGSASDTPKELIWLLDQVKSSAPSGIYDYGHFQLLGLDMTLTLNALLPRCSFITAKVPGDGLVD